MKKLFLSHKEQHPQLRNFESALRELMQIEPVLLEDCPKMGGMPLPELGEHYMKQCEGVLFLLTKDAQAGDGRWHPSSSVSMEIKIGEQLFSQDKRFYMLERDTTFPAMAEEPTYISFSWDEMMPALVALRRTLRKAGLIEEPLMEGQDIVAPLNEVLFVLETVANHTTVPFRELSTLYQQNFKKDHADFSILIDQMKSRGMIGEDSKIIRSDGVRKVTVLILGSPGFRFLGKHREKERAEKAEAVTRGLKTLGLIK